MGPGSSGGLGVIAGISLFFTNQGRRYVDHECTRQKTKTLLGVGCETHLEILERDFLSDSNLPQILSACKGMETPEVGGSAGNGL